MKHKKLLTIIIFIGIIIISYCLIQPILGLMSDETKIKDWVLNKGALGIIGFILLIMLQVIVAVIPGGPFELAAGYIFGPIAGVVICIFSATLASIIVFILVRKFGIKLASIFISEKNLKLIEKYEDSPDHKKRIEKVLAIIFVIPGSPKDVLNYLAGLTKIPIINWIFINLLGRIPGIVVSTLSGSAISTGKTSMLFGSIRGIIILFLIGYLLKDFKNNVFIEKDN